MKRMLILALATSVVAFAQEAPSNTQEQPSAQDNFITDELTGSKVFETGANKVAPNDAQDATAEATTGAKDTKDAKDIKKEGEENKEQLTQEKPKDSASNSKSTQPPAKNTTKSSQAQKKPQGKKTTTATSKKPTTKSTGAKKTTSTGTKSTSKKPTTKTTGTNKTTQSKTTSKSGTTGGKTQSAPKTQTTTKPNGETQQEKQNTQSNVQGTTQNPARNVSEKQNTQATATQQEKPSVSESSSVPPLQNPKTDEASQNLKTQGSSAQEPVQTEGAPQNATSLPPAQSKTSSAVPASSGKVVQPATPSTAPATTSAPQNQDKAGEKQAEAKPKAPPASPKHFVSMKNSQYLDVTYPEGGWIFLGEEGEKPLLRYFGRKVAGDVTSFSLRSRAEGKTVLHFYKNTDSGVIDDYIEVEIKGKNETQDRAKVTPYDAQSTTPPSPAKTTDTDTTVPQAKAQSEGVDIGYVDLPEADEQSQTDQLVSFGARIEGDDTLLVEAKRLALLKDYDEALRLLEKVLAEAGQSADEALFLQAQIFEVSGEQKNIRGALDCYETIVRRYPESSLWDKANERAVYLKKFYFDIR